MVATVDSNLLRTNGSNALPAVAVTPLPAMAMALSPQIEGERQGF
jgi:hypothetical protein